MPNATPAGSVTAQRTELAIETLTAATPDRITGAATLLHAAFSAHGAWTTMEEARAEVLESLGPDRVSRVAVDADGGVVGWIGAVSQYDGLVWELHPIVVSAEWRRRGVGRTLVRDLESIITARGGLTLWAGADDLCAETSLGGVDLFALLPKALTDVTSWGNHPLPFYRRLGFEVVAAMPDANGPGRPDIFLAKRIGTAPANPPA